MLGQANNQTSRFLAVVLCLCLFISTGCGGDAKNSAHDDALPLANRISNNAGLVAQIRHGLREYASCITIRFDYGSDIFEELNAVIGDLMEAALAETENPAEGDYIRYQYGGYTWESSYTAEEDLWHYTVRITPLYYNYYSQEQQAAEAAEALLADLDIRSIATDEERVRALYGWICGNVVYDKVHRKNPYYHTCSTAYAALVQHTATCQGYCTALYRLLRMAGIRCRVVTGSAGEESRHAWMLICVDGMWYGADPTWDAGQEAWSYYLAGEEDFADHRPDERFQTDAFRQTYPMARASLTDILSTERR